MLTARYFQFDVLPDPDAGSDADAAGLNKTEGAVADTADAAADEDEDDESDDDDDGQNNDDDDEDYAK